MRAPAHVAAPECARSGRSPRRPRRGRTSRARARIPASREPPAARSAVAQRREPARERGIGLALADRAHGQVDRGAGRPLVLEARRDQRRAARAGTGTSESRARRARARARSRRRAGACRTPRAAGTTRRARRARRPRRARRAAADRSPSARTRSIVAAAGAGPWPEIANTRSRRASRTRIGTSPPGPFWVGSSTQSAKPIAQAASAALPPLASCCAPICAARWCPAATAPPNPRTVGRVVVTGPSMHDPLLRV